MPSAREGHMVAVEEIFFDKKCFNDVMYIFHASRWSGPIIDGVPPAEREGHTATVVGTVMYVYGGSSSWDISRCTMLGFRRLQCTRATTEKTGPYLTLHEFMAKRLSLYFYAIFILYIGPFRVSLASLSLSLSLFCLVDSTVVILMSNKK